MKNSIFLKVDSSTSLMHLKPFYFGGFPAGFKDISHKNTLLSAVEDEELMADDSNDELNVQEPKKEKPQAKKKPKKTLEINTTNIPPTTVTLSTINSINDYEINKPSKYAKPKRPLTEKEKSAKKTRLKNKYLSSFKIINKIANMRIPSSLYYMVKKSRLEIIDLDLYQQKSILDIAAELSKEELTIMLLLLPETTEEMKFLKGTLLSRQFIDTLFRNISNDIIK